MLVVAGLGKNMPPSPSAYMMGRMMAHAPRSTLRLVHIPDRPRGNSRFTPNTATAKKWSTRLKGLESSPPSSAMGPAARSPPDAR